jgi:2,5-diamino-6-(ribosylamino)-4(3H)-pyrimidinone 5'-phosphate reductase
VHVAVSLDGATAGFEPDVARFYALAGTWREDVTLAGADTILAQEEALASVPLPGPAAGGPLLAVVDSRRRVGAWDALRDCGHWSRVVALRGDARAPQSGPPVREIITHGERVDLAGALAALVEQDGARMVRVDSGGALAGALLREGLVDELSLLVHPVIAGGDRRWHGLSPAPALTLERLAGESFDDGVVWLRYRVTSG